MKTFEPHAFKIFLLHPRRLLRVDLLGVELEESDYWSMIRESALLDALERPLLYLSVFVTLTLPKDSVTPGRNSLLLACIIRLGPFIILVSWSKVNRSLGEDPVELILQFTGVSPSILIKSLNHLIVLL